MNVPCLLVPEIVREGEVGVYHVWNRCVRRAFLCGIDWLTGQDYNHRRDWIRAFEQRLASLFALEIGFRAELSNHIHLVLRARPDVVNSWSDRDVTRRMLTINRLVKSKDGETIREITDGEIAIEMSHPKRVAEFRTKTDKSPQ